MMTAHVPKGKTCEDAIIMSTCNGHFTMTVSLKHKPPHVPVASTLIPTAKGMKTRLSGPAMAIILRGIRVNA